VVFADSRDSYPEKEYPYTGRRAGFGLVNPGCKAERIDV
jgi:hypothetical protein